MVPLAQRENVIVTFKIIENNTDILFFSEATIMNLWKTLKNISIRILYLKQTLCAEWFYHLHTYTVWLSVMRGLMLSLFVQARACCRLMFCSKVSFIEGHRRWRCKFKKKKKRKKSAYISICSFVLCMVVHIYPTEVLLALNLTPSRCSHVGLLFTNEE